MSSVPPTERVPMTPPPEYSVHEKQRNVVQSDARYKVLEWGRRAGKNICAIIEIIEHAREPWQSDWGADDPEKVLIWWVARSYDQAEKYGFLPMRSALPNQWIDSYSESEPYEIHLTNGVTIEFRTYDHPETLQGAGVDKQLIDEADYMKDTLWYDDLEPMLMDTRGSAMFISKPVRPQSYFQTLAERGRSADHPQHYYSHATSADNPFIDEDPADKRGTMPDAKFRQQYLAELPDDGGQVFKKLGERLFTVSDADLHGEIIDGTGELWQEPDALEPPYSVGADFARHRDYRVTIGIDSTGQLAYYSRNQNESWDEIQSDLQAVHSQYEGVVVPDASRDNKLISDLWNAGVNLDPTKFTKQNKADLIEDLTTTVEQGELAFPDDDRLDQLRLELRMLQREVTRSGYAKYHAPDGSHDDTVDALALAVKGLEQARRHNVGTTASADGEERFGDSDGDAIAEAVDQYRRQYQDASTGKW